MEFIQQIQATLMATQIEGKCDLLLYNGPIDRDGFYEVSKKAVPSSEKVLFILTTSGGDPHSAYRIARLLGDRYKQFVALIGAPCKSAGTLVVMGADEVVIDETGELGPLDIQLRRADEPLEAESGLDVVTSLHHLTGAALNAWESAFVGIQGTSELGTKACADLATGLVSELFGKLFAQVDPVRLGAVVRANSIATRYGTELAESRKNLKTNAVSNLVLRYPAHGYAIDLQEAKKIFNRVREPTLEELDLLLKFEDVVRTVRRTEQQRIVYRLDELLQEEEKKEGAAAEGEEKNDGETKKTGAEPPSGNAASTASSGGNDATNRKVTDENKPSTPRRKQHRD